MFAKKPMYKIAVLCALFCLILPFLYGQARSRAVAHIGTINLNAVILLHPAMTGYNPYTMAFKLDSGKVSQDQVKQRSEQQQQDISRLEAEVKRLRAAIQEQYSRFERQSHQITTNYLEKIKELATGPAGLQRQDYLVDKNRLESSHNAQLQALGGQLATAEESLDRLRSIPLNEGYTTPEETQKRFDAILYEIQQYTQQAATQKGISVVLNSYSHTAPAGRSADIMPAELDSSRLFNRPFASELSSDEAAVAGYYSLITSEAANWLLHGDKILRPFKSKISNNQVFIGGVDLTPEVLNALFKSYKIDQYIGNAVIEAIRDY